MILPDRFLRLARADDALTVPAEGHAPDLARMPAQRVPDRALPLLRQSLMRAVRYPLLGLILTQ